MKIRIALAGGGSGGHMYPLISVVREIRNQCDSSKKKISLDIRFFGNPGTYKELLEKEDIEVVSIVSSKLRRYFDIKNFFDLFRFFFGLLQSIWKLYWFMPDITFSKGGPGALSVLSACKFYMIPIIIHDSDAIPGLTNKTSGKGARIIELAFESARSHFPKRVKINIVGTPVREAFVRTTKTPEESRLKFNLNSKLPVIFVIGGSQGAKPLNDFVFENAELLLSRYQIIHQVGLKNFEGYNNEFEFFSEKYNPELKRHYVYRAYFEEQLKDAYNAADLVLARASATVIFEIAYLGKPSILVPIPDSANNHQWENAIQYEDAGACLVVGQENLLGKLFTVQVDSLLANPEKYSAMKDAAKKFYIPHAAEKIAKDILEIGKNLTIQADLPKRHNATKRAPGSLY
ncbi:MAG: hypothetical protein COU08_03315 [Candidatus Harrisonbacteria bacterium CG10_big_fil_rev_8_21_14_0_10_42_17]|uniref:UDP-N-acetylglucosamine--N-acetylmuramyl-(pentapeptide) pyrophosphoryl-undecaprenol N-acetylglucosamine transferase n=1 Tax=Candidatus Harrisonbacteria bacterium CG10_big_fil_rev_8_21_14_0_10_42_17 TaxID=1974584 RepID=A0A2M6WHN8_9BACT|nr:MAG: hypothetical protein COU08_03315 [Candidatus Harrisonbacteria bacterium CG10_big_fil_rev_8_21_14_0_10_42_17]